MLCSLIMVVELYCVWLTEPSMKTTKTKAARSSPTAFRFDPAVKQALDFIAEREGRSKANMLEWLIRKHCEREGLGWPPVSQELDLGSLEEVVAAVQVHMAGGEKPAWAGKKVAIAGRRATTATNADSQVEKIPSVKKTKNRKQGSKKA